MKPKPVRTSRKVQIWRQRQGKKKGELEQALLQPSKTREEAHVEELLDEMRKLENEHLEDYGYNLQEGREWEELKREKARSYKRKKNQLRQRFSELNKKHKEVLNNNLKRARNKLTLADQRRFERGWTRVKRVYAIPIEEESIKCSDIKTMDSKE